VATTPAQLVDASQIAIAGAQNLEERMNFLAFLVCLARAHHWRPSRSRPGYMTCVKCRMRKRIAA
jgi:hypothetical protein